MKELQHLLGRTSGALPSEKELRSIGAMPVCVCVNARVFVFCGSLLFRGCGCCNCLPGSLGWSQVAGGEQFVLARMVFVGLLSWSLDFDLSLVRGGNPKRDLT